jgi:glycosyltransferase involved in cell wall biosynthesis
VLRKKILVLVDWFAPGYKAGGPIQSCVNFSTLMKTDFDISVLTTDTDHGEQNPYEGIKANKWISTVFEGVNIFYLRKSTLRFKQVKEQIDLVNADFIYLNQMFSAHLVIYPLWLLFRDKIKSKVILCPRGALYDSALNVKPLKKKLFLQLFRLSRLPERVEFHATNQREQEAILRHFPKATVRIANNAPKNNQTEFQTIVKCKGALKCIYISRIVPIKNLLLLLEALKNVNSKIELTIIGPAEDKNYWNECQSIIDSLPANCSVNYLGSKRNDELDDFIKMNHLFVLPTKGENFGHAIFEALLVGRPVLISDQTPWKNLRQYKAGVDIPLDDKKRFIEELESFALLEQDEYDRWAQNSWQFARNFINSSTLRDQYLHLFE